MKLKHLNLDYTRVADLSPLAGMPLAYSTPRRFLPSITLRWPAHLWSIAAYKIRPCAIFRFSGIRP
jgi:hypothetical protein